MLRSPGMRWCARSITPWHVMSGEDITGRTDSRIRVRNLSAKGISRFVVVRNSPRTTRMMLFCVLIDSRRMTACNCQNRGDNGVEFLSRAIASACRTCVRGRQAYTTCTKIKSLIDLQLDVAGCVFKSRSWHPGNPWMHHRPPFNPVALALGIARSPYHVTASSPVEMRRIIGVAAVAVRYFGR